MSIAVGQQFTIRGQYLDRLPAELVLATSRDTLLNVDIPDFKVLKLVSKTESTAVFECIASHTFSTMASYQYLGTPFAAPRTEILYDSL